MLVRLALVAWLVLAVTGCGGKGKSEPQASPTPGDSYLARKGEVLPLRSALDGVAFRPFIPSRQIVEAALIAPYNGGEDIRENRGIGFEYVSNHDSFILQQWPGRPKSGPNPLPPERGCALSAYPIAGGATGKQGVLWSNGRIVVNLFASGNASDRATFAEARRLVRLGACR